MHSILIGTSGWQYRDWNGVFYPAEVTGKAQLPYFADRFRTVEINSTFYHMPRESTVQNWHDTVSDDFVFTLKLNRYLTHTKRLQADEGFEDSLKRFLLSARHLDDKLGTILVQLPPSMHTDTERLARFFGLVEKYEAELRYRFPLAMEFRHVSWFDTAVNELLDNYGVANVINDSPGRWPEQRRITGRTLYIRLHGHTELYRSSYSDEQLAEWAAFIRKHDREFDSGYVYFNNDYDAVAIGNARTLMDLLA